MLCRFGILNYSETSACFDLLEAGRPVPAHSRQKYAYNIFAEGVRRGFKQHVDGGPRIHHRFICGKRKVAALDQEVIVGRADVDVSFPNFFFVFDVNYRQLYLARKEWSEGRGILAAAVLHHSHGKREILRQPSQENT